MSPTDTRISRTTAATGGANETTVRTVATGAGGRRLVRAGVA